MDLRKTPTTQTFYHLTPSSVISSASVSDYSIKNDCYIIDNSSQDSESLINVVETNDICNNESPKMRKITGLQQTLLFKSISCVLSKNMSPEFNSKYFCEKTKSGHFDSKDKQLFLSFLYNHRFLCDFTNPSLYEILCHFKFLGRTETLPYKNFVSELRSNLAMHLEELFTEPDESDMMFEIYEKLREIYFWRRK